MDYVSCVGEQKNFINIFFSLTSLGPIFFNCTIDSLYPASKHVYKSGYDLLCSTGGRHELAMPEQNIKVSTNFI
jgi:hypothetical protein